MAIRKDSLFTVWAACSTFNKVTYFDIFIAHLRFCKLNYICYSSTNNTIQISWIQISGQPRSLLDGPQSITTSQHNPLQELLYI